MAVESRLGRSSQPTVIDPKILFDAIASDPKTLNLVNLIGLTKQAQIHSNSLNYGPSQNSRLIAINKKS